MKLKTPIISTVVAMLTALVVLLLRLFPTGLDALYTGLVRWATALAAVALVVGVVNLINVHISKLTDESGTAAYSGVLIGAFLLTFLLAFGLGPNGSLAGVEPANWIFQYIQVPIETSLVAILAVSLIYAAARLLRRSPNLFSIIFISAAVLALVGTSLLRFNQFGLLGDLVGGAYTWLTAVVAAAGARGLLLGVGLGAVAAGLRILIGTDRPYGG